MIVAYWHVDHPDRIELIEDSICPWLTANWVEKRPALPEEIEMYNNGICTYKAKE